MKAAIALASFAVSAMLTGCVAYGPPGPGPAPGAYEYGPYPAGVVAYDGYYDGAYGQFYDGYWGGDGAFYYADRDHHFHRDFNGHFRHQGVAGFRHVQGGGPRGGARPGAAPHR